MIPSGKLVSHHPGILYRHHAEQIVIWIQGDPQATGNKDFATLAYPNVQCWKVVSACLTVSKQLRYGMLTGKTWPVFSLLPPYSQHPALWGQIACASTEPATSASPPGGATASFELSIPHTEIIFSLEALHFNRVIYIDDCEVFFIPSLVSVWSFWSCLPLVQNLTT